MKSSSILRRAVLAGGVALVFLVGAGVAPGDPGNGAVRIPLFGPPFDLPARYCGFPIHVEPITQNEYIIHDTTLPDGTEIQRITGNAVLRFTNLDTGKSIVENLSGPSTVTIYPDGSQLLDTQGHNLFIFGPLGQANTGEPGLVVTSGHAVVFYSAFMGGLLGQSFTLSGTQENLCALLS